MLRRFFLFSVLFGLLALPSSGVSASPQTQLAVGWIIAQQQSDGGFEMAGFPGFETPDAVLAIAENAQTDTVWSAAGSEVLSRRFSLAAAVRHLSIIWMILPSPLRLPVPPPS